MLVKANTIHIISHDVPYPMDYGGVIDIFCTIRSLHAAGWNIILHCFDYGRGRQPELNQYCSEVHYYSRHEGHKGISFSLPYIVASRADDSLLNRLLEDEFPILLEGIHSTYLLRDQRFRERKMVLRLFNVESIYYHQLFRHERSLFRKLFYLNESRMLRAYEKQIANRLPVLAMTEKDRQYYMQHFGARSVHMLPIMVPYGQVDIKEGLGGFCLYHGNLEVAENEKAVVWLLEEVFTTLKIPFVIAGKNPSKRLERLAHMQSHTCLVANPGDRELADLISKAQVNLLPSFNSTGIKLKLLNALFNGRHCIVNEAALEGTPLGPLCHVAEKASAVQRLVQQLYYLPFGEEEIALRKKILHQHYNNETNVKAIIAYLS